MAVWMGFLALVLPGCEGGGRSGSPDAVGDVGDANGYTVDTQVSSDTVEIGQAVTVTCSVTGPSGAVETATTVTVTPADGWTLDGTTVTFTQTGDFKVACEAPDVPATDETPAAVTVTEGRPTSADTVVDPASIAAGASATATCTAKDGQGNPAAGQFEVQVTPATGVVVTAGTTAGTFKLEGKTAGTYSVACALLAGGAVDDTPATLTVTAGALAKIVTTLDADTMTAGGTTPGHCQAQDAYGNVITGIPFAIDATAGLDITSSEQGFSATGTKAGSYDVTCKAQDGTTATLEKDTLTIEAGPAVNIQLKLVPAKPVYQVGNQVKVGFDLVDQYGNPVPGGAITNPTVDPTTGTTQISADQFQFDAEGRFVFAACDATNAALCDDIEAWCDGTAPVLTITYPERGATIDGDRRVVITGTVTDAASQVKGLTINGQDVSLNSDGSFQFPVQPDQGLNLIDASVSDTFDNEYRTLRSYLYSSTWYPMDQPDPLASLVPQAVKAYMDDTLFYNADTTDEATISRILEMALADLDLGSLIPNPISSVEQGALWTTCKYDIYLDSLVFDPPQLQVKPDFGALLLHGVIPNLKANIRLVQTDGVFPCPGSQSGQGTADQVILDTKVNMDVDPATHLIRMSAGSTNLTLNNFDVTIDSWFYNLIVGLLQGTLEGLLKDQVTTMLTDLINDLPQTLNDALAKPIEFQVPELIPGMNAVTLKFSLQPQSINFDPEGGALDLNAAINADHLVDRTILGSIGRASCLSDTPELFGFDLANPEKLMLALFDDALNEALYSLWDGRFLNIHLTSAALGDSVDLSSYGVENLDATTAALIPPVVTSCNPAGTLTVQVGDLYLDATMDLQGEPVAMHLFLFLEIELNLAVADDPEKGRVISATIGSPPKVFDMDIEWFQSDYWAESDIRDLVMGVVPVAFGQLAGKPITFAIPSFNLKGLLGSGGSIPITLPDKDLVILPKTLGHDKGYVNVSAGIELHDPVPVTP